MEKQSQVGSGASIGKTELAFGDAKIMLNEAQNRTKIMPVIVHVACIRIGGDDNQWNTESVLIVALHTVQDRRLLVIVPASPVIPSDDDRGVLPIGERLSLHGVGAGAVADGVDNGSHPGGSAAIVAAGVVGVRRRRSDPSQIVEIAISKIGQYLRKIISDDVASPAGTLSPARHTDVVNRVRSSPNGAHACGIVHPVGNEVGHGLVFKTRVYLVIFYAVWGRGRIWGNDLDSRRG